MLRALVLKVLRVVLALKVPLEALELKVLLEIVALKEPQVAALKEVLELKVIKALRGRSEVFGRKMDQAIYYPLLIMLMI